MERSYWSTRSLLLLLLLLPTREGSSGGPQQRPQRQGRHRTGRGRAFSATGRPGSRAGSSEDSRSRRMARHWGSKTSQLRSGKKRLIVRVAAAAAVADGARHAQHCHCRPCAQCEALLRQWARDRARVGWAAVERKVGRWRVSRELGVEHVRHARVVRKLRGPRRRRRVRM
jgi:hypothetical protein